MCPEYSLGILQSKDSVNKTPSSFIPNVHHTSWSATNVYLAIRNYKIKVFERIIATKQHKVAIQRIYQIHNVASCLVVIKATCLGNVAYIATCLVGSKKLPI
jgi:hypothetical protein